MEEPQSANDLGEELETADFVGRPRPRRKQHSIEALNRAAIFKRVETFFNDDIRSRQDDWTRRVQRYAKFRMWTEGKSWPWEGASDIGLPDMMAHSLRVQDTLHNAFMSQRPVINATPLNKADEPRATTIDNLLDYQVFVENQGETKVGELIEQFVNDGVFTCFTPWVQDEREVCERYKFPKWEEEQGEFVDYLQALLQNQFPDAYTADQIDQEGWEWLLTVDEGTKKIRVSFFTNDDDSILMHVKKNVIVFDGPVLIPKAYEDVIVPPKVANLQRPGPSNPGGAPHVILRDYPTVDEIRALQKSGYYDLMSLDEAMTMKVNDAIPSNQPKTEAINTIQGEQPVQQVKDDGQKTVTRLMVFDMYDLDGDGVAEDVIWTVLLEPKMLVRARYLTEQFPSNPPRRPVSEAAFIPIEGRREGISLLELLEGLHDIQKMLFDMGADSNTISVLPFFFYRAAGATKPESINIFPGMGYPLGDPQRDVHFPQINNQSAQGMTLNLLGLTQQMQERTTMTGDFQFGRVPAGKSSALRTIGAMSMVQSQGEARPERILRRFFIGISQIFAMMHELNKAFLPEKKKIRIAAPRPDQDPYQEVSDRAGIDGVYMYDFRANTFNSSKAALQQALGQLAGAILSPLTMQLGLVGPENVYNLFRDLGMSWGVSIDKYLKPPSPEANLPKITAEEAVQTILSTQMPYGVPMEVGGAVEHLQKLVQFTEDDAFGLLDPAQLQIFTDYFKAVAQRAQQQMQMEQMAAAAAAFQQASGGAMPGQQNPGGAPAQSPPEVPGGPPPVSGGAELQDESLPTAGGGGQEEMAA